MADAFSSFLDEYFLNPLRYPDKYAPYNVVNTVTLAIIALAAIFVIYKLLKHWNIQIDKPFYWAVVPFVVVGSFVRVLVDAALLPRQVFIFGIELFPFVTPYIYVLVFLVFLACLGAAKLVEKRGGSFPKTLQRAGLILAVLAFLPLALNLRYPLHVVLIAGLAIAAFGVFEFAFRFFTKTAPDGVERGAVFAQVFDGAATFVGVGIGTPATSYFEQHVVGNAIFDFFGGPFAFYLIKLLFAALAVYLIRRELAKPEEREEKIYILLLVTIFGLGPGLRDATRIAIGV